MIHSNLPTGLKIEQNDNSNTKITDSCTTVFNTGMFKSERSYIVVF